MIELMFKAILPMSLIGVIFVTILLCTGIITKKLFSSGWHYYIWVTAMVIMLLPIKINIQTESVKPVAEVVMRETVPTRAQTIFREISFAAEKEINIISLIWITVAVLIFAMRLSGYVFFLIKTVQNSAAGELTFEGRTIKVYRSYRISSPMITGVFRPVLFLPDKEMTEEELKNVLAHEIMHLKRGDVLIRWLMSAVKCIHWFNPAVYIIASKIHILCEISCDLRVTKNMSDREKYSYMNTILSLAQKKASALPIPAMASGKKQLKKRFIHIKSERRKGKISLISGIAVYISIVGAIIFGGGILAAEMDNISYKPVTVRVAEKPAEDAEGKIYTPEIKEETVKLPEIISEEKVPPVSDKTPAPEITPVPEEMHEPEMENEIQTSELLPAPEDGEDIYRGYMIVEEAHGEMNLEKVRKYSAKNPIKSDDETVNLKTHCTVMGYDFDEKTVLVKRVKPDKNGNIILYFDSDFSTVTADINICEPEMYRKGYSYNIPTDKQRIYYFCGFEPDKEYDVTISSYYPGNYNIEGKVLIY